MEEREYEEIVMELIRYANSIKDMFTNLKPTDFSHTGFVFAQVGLIRLYASFEVVGLIIRQGYALEAIVLARFIHEQLAYLYSLRLTDDLEDIDKLQVTKCITKYKERVDYIGNVYGMTSEFAHLDMHLMNYYLSDFDLGTRKAAVTTKFRDKDIGYTMLLTLVMAVELYLDMIFVFLDIDELRSYNKELSDKADNIKMQVEALIREIKISIR